MPFKLKYKYKNVLLYFGAFLEFPSKRQINIIDVNAWNKLHWQWNMTLFYLGVSLFLLLFCWCEFNLVWSQWAVVILVQMLMSEDVVVVILFTTLASFWSLKIKNITLQYIYISNHNIPSQYILLDCLAELGLTVASFQSERKSIEKV